MRRERTWNGLEYVIFLILRQKKQFGRIRELVTIHSRYEKVWRIVK